MERFKDAWAHKSSSLNPTVHCFNSLVLVPQYLRMKLSHHKYLHVLALAAGSPTGAIGLNMQGILGMQGTTSYRLSTPDRD